MIRGLLLTASLLAAGACGGTMGSSLFFDNGSSHDLVVRVNADGTIIDRFVPRGSGSLVFAASQRPRQLSVVVLHWPSCERADETDELPPEPHIGMGMRFDQPLRANGGAALFDPDCEELAPPTDACH